MVLFDIPAGIKRYYVVVPSYQADGFGGVRRHLITCAHGDFD